MKQPDAGWNGKRRLTLPAVRHLMNPLRRRPVVGQIGLAKVKDQMRFPHAEFPEVKVTEPEHHRRLGKAFEIGLFDSLVAWLLVGQGSGIPLQVHAFQRQGISPRLIRLC